MVMIALWAAADLLWWRWADLRLRRLPWRPARRGAARSLNAAFAAAMIAYLVWVAVAVENDHVPAGGVMDWHVASYLWHLAALPGLMLLLALAWGGRGVARLLSRRNQPARRVDTPSTTEDAARFTRRQALGAAAAAIPPLVTVGAARVFSARTEAFIPDHRVELRVPALPEDLNGLTIAHVSDLHLGKFLTPATAARVADAVNALAADLVVFTGDLINVGAMDQLSHGLDFLRRLDPRHGLAVIEGNHDIMNEAEGFERAVKGAGFNLLLDEEKTFDLPGRRTPVQFLGVTWGELLPGRLLGRTGKNADKLYREYSKDAAADSVRLVAGLRKEPGPGRERAFPILLAHHPHAFDPAVGAGLPLTLSGHTHGGQIMLTENIGAGPLRFRYWTGAYRQGGGRLFVNNGIGTWFPVRINAPAEIVHLTLRRGA